jgi:hypothetical protein
MAKELMEAALAYAAAGLAVLPLYWTDAAGRCSCGRPANCKPGKHPHSSLVPHGVKEATTHAQTIRRWWERCPMANIGVAGGRASGNLGWLDFDRRADELFPRWVEAIGSLYASLPVVRTGIGYRVAFRVDGFVPKNEPNIARGAATPEARRGELLIELKGDGGYGIAPPSRHPTGVFYTQLQGDLKQVPTLAATEARFLLDAARALNEFVLPERTSVAGAKSRTCASPRYEGFARKPDRQLWSQLWSRLDLAALERLLPELHPRPYAGYLGCLTCPQCGQPRAFIYPPNGAQGVSLRCNRQNNCAFHQTLFRYLCQREGGAKAALRRLREAVGLAPSEEPIVQFGASRRENGFALTREDFKEAYI